MIISVLLADDHAIVRDGLHALLSQDPAFKVVGKAANGREAVRAVAALKPDIVIMDISMPELNGLEATGMIRAQHPDTEVIMLSMHAGPEQVVRALKAGARGYLLKDTAGDELREAIQAVQTGRRYLSEAISASLIDSFLSQEPPADPLEGLSSREREVMQLIVEGRSLREIADLLFLSPRTVETYRTRLMNKLGVSDLPALVRLAIQSGMIPLE